MQSPAIAASAACGIASGARATSRARRGTGEAWIASAELDLDLGDRRASPAGTNLAHVDTECGAGAIGECQRLLGASYVGREHAPISASVAREELVPGRAGKLLRVEPGRGEGPFELGPAVQACRGIAGALDGLQPAAPRMAQPQRDACGGERAIRRVVVGADHA